MKTIGSFHSAASASALVERALRAREPSPKKQSVTRPSPRYFDAKAAPAASGTWPPTMP